MIRKYFRYHITNYHYIITYEVTKDKSLHGHNDNHEHKAADSQEIVGQRIKTTYKSHVTFKIVEISL